jgi:Dyp-type peroxidase family
LIFRRLRQDVSTFRRFLEEKAQELKPPSGAPWTARQLGARLVGRWEDGTPVTLIPDKWETDISGDPMAINHFAYGGVSAVAVTEGDSTRTIPSHTSDEPGLRCPHFAHVRKVNPRNLPTDQGEMDKTLTFQMLRRGIPYGQPYGPGQEDADRGLLFLAYQTSFEDQFRLLNNVWMNNPSAPERSGEGHDMLVGQDEAGRARFGSFRDEDGDEWQQVSTLSRWVIPTGGAFLFSPSLKFFEMIGENSPDGGL